MAIEGTAEAKNLSTFHNGQWIWHSYGSSTTEFPYSRLTHSYVATEDYARTLPISTKQKVGLCVSLALTALVNFGLLCHNVDKARKIGKGNTKVVRRWLRISSSLAHIIVAVILLTSLVASNIPPILASLWHFSTILSIQVCSSHGIFLILDKWVQVCLASTGTTPVLEPIRLLFMAAFIGLWTTSTIAGHVHLLTQLSWEDQITAKFFNDFSRSYYIPILIVCSVSMAVTGILTFSALRWLLFIDPKRNCNLKKKCLLHWFRFLFEEQKASDTENQELHQHHCDVCQMRLSSIEASCPKGHQSCCARIQTNERESLQGLEEPLYFMNSACKRSESVIFNRLWKMPMGSWLIVDIRRMDCFQTFVVVVQILLKVTMRCLPLGFSLKNFYAHCKGDNLQGKHLTVEEVCGHGAGGAIYTIDSAVEKEISFYATSEESSRPTSSRRSQKRVQFNENSEVFTSFEEEEEFDMKKRRKSSAEKVKGQIFDVAFKKDSQELSAAKLRDQMKVIIQASMEEDEEKIRCLEKAPKLAWAQLSQDFSRSIEEDPDHIKPDSNPKKAPRVPKLKRNVVENCDAVAQTVFEDPCTLPMKHRHDTEGLYESPECSADLSEFAISIGLNLVHHLILNGALVILVVVYSNLSENLWEMVLLVQVIACCCHPILEFLISAKIRFFCRDKWDALKGENIPSQTVFVA